METNERPNAWRLFRIGQRIYRKPATRDRRRRPVSCYPELRLSNGWFREAGFRPGDRVAVRVHGPGVLIVVRVPSRGEASAAAGGPAPKPAEDTLPPLPVAVRL